VEKRAARRIPAAAKRTLKDLSSRADNALRALPPAPAPHNGRLAEAGFEYGLACNPARSIPKNISGL
jgi:hypothetical protein